MTLICEEFHSSTPRLPLVFAKGEGLRALATLAITVIIAVAAFAMPPAPGMGSVFVIAYPAAVIASMTGTALGWVSLRSGGPRNWRGLLAFSLNLTIMCVLLAVMVIGYLSSLHPTRMGGGP